MLFLAVLFMARVVSGPDLPVHGVELAQATRSTLQPGAGKEDAINISVNRDDSFYFDSKKVTPEEIPDLIRAAVQQGSEPKVYLGIDARANYGSVKSIARRNPDRQNRKCCSAHGLNYCLNRAADEPIFI
jgi:biopolymer transport protein ExbD